MFALLLSLIDCLMYICIVCILMGSCLCVIVNMAMDAMEAKGRGSRRSYRAAEPAKMPLGSLISLLVLISGVTGYYYMYPAFVSQFMMATLLFLIDLNYLFYSGCMIVLSFMMLLIAHKAIENTRIWWPELIHTSIIGLTLRLLNMMWGSPFKKPSNDSGMKSGLVGIASYLIYICCSMAVSCKFSGARMLLKTFVISLTFVLLDMFVQPCSFSDMIATLVGFPGTIAKALLPLFFLAALSFVVFVFLDTWAEMLLPSITDDYPRGVFVSIAVLTFMVMQTILGIPVEEPSIFSDMKAGLLGITDMINKYQGAYVVIKCLTVLVIPLLSRESRPIMYTTAVFIVALSLLLPGPGTPTEYPASTLVMDDFIQKTITNFVNSQINGVDGEIKQLTAK